MITATIERIEQTGATSIAVVVRFDGPIPEEKHYTFNFEEDVTLAQLKTRVKDDLAKMNSIQTKIDSLQSLVGKTL